MNALDLTWIGALHTLLSLVAVAAGILALVRHHAIAPRQRAGLVFIVATSATCLTGFALFRHGFGKPHVLGIVTLVTLAIGGWAGRARGASRRAPTLETVAYSTALLFHAVPGLTETLVRVPVGAPVFTDREAPGLVRLIGAVFAVGCVAIVLQARAARRRTRRAEVSTAHAQRTGGRERDSVRAPVGDRPS